MGHVIVGIHGIGNKPRKEQLADWWKQAIVEGLEKNTDYKGDVTFRMVYWANLFYKYPFHSDRTFPRDSHFNHRPYEPAPEGAIRSYARTVADVARSLFTGPFDAVLEALSSRGMLYIPRATLEKNVRDATMYYDDEQIALDPWKPGGDCETGAAKATLRGVLAEVLHEEAAKDNSTILVGHSMGSIIAYDTLRDLGRQEVEDLHVPHLITLGSPLGLPLVKDQIVRERTYDPRLRTPTLVTGTWRNFADLRDIVAVDPTLGNDFWPNDGGVQIEDKRVHVDYVPPGAKKRDTHNIYGYLRTPEFSEHLCSILSAA